MATNATRAARRKPSPPPDDLDPVAAADAAGLRHVNGSGPGIRRVRAGRGFRYLGVDGKPLRDAATLVRIRSLAIPPAWIDVWISPISRGHLQATGRDARGRKQYRYHDEWRRARDETKYHRMIAFGEALAGLRRRVSRDIRRPGLPREKVVATVVRLLDDTGVRVGNTEYARENDSFGLTTLRDRHVEAGRGKLSLVFIGKAGKHQDVDVDDPRLARIVKRCRDLPGHDLFQYLDEDGERKVVGSEDVNDYVRDVTGDAFTAKDFRTWTGTVMAASELRKVGPGKTKRAATRNVTRAIEAVADHLGNTPAICRKSYVHPQVVEAYLEGTLEGRASTASSRAGLRADERELLRLLKRLARAARTASA